jgi:hypothetical protein
MSLVDPFQIHQVWGSHIPPLTAVLRTLKPDLTVECGTGLYSTPIILRYSKQTIHIEHDSVWLDKVKAVCGNRDSATWYFRRFNAFNSTSIDELPKGEFDEMMNYYLGISAMFVAGRIDLLFVDTFRPCRVPALTHLGPKAKMIILHDMEKDSPRYYKYDMVEDMLKRDFYVYHYRPLGEINGHTIPWTDFYVRKQAGLMNAQSLTVMEELNYIAGRESHNLWGFFTHFDEGDGK